MVFFTTDGAVAQMGERVTGSHKVRGSIPLSSTNDIKGLGVVPSPFILCDLENGIQGGYSGRFCSLRSSLPIEWSENSWSRPHMRRGEEMRETSSQ